MKHWFKSLLVSLAVALMVMGPTPQVHAQNTELLLHDDVEADGDGLILDVAYYNSVTLDVAISDTATANFKVRNEYGGTWRGLSCLETSSTTPVQSTTASGLFQCNVVGMKQVMVPISGYSDGTVRVYARATPAVFSRGIGGGSPVVVQDIVVRKASDETINNSNTVQDDNELFFPMVANSVYLFDGIIYYNVTTTADFQLDFTVPAGATGRRQLLYPTSAASSCSTTSTAYWGGSITAGVTAIGGIGITCETSIRGTITTGGTAGNFQVQWAQNNLDASDATVLAGSFLRYRKL